MGKILLIHPGDFAAVALEEIREQETVTGDGCTVTAAEDIPQGHKIAVRDIGEGEAVQKYGLPIGRAAHGILCGSHIEAEDIVEAYGISIELSGSGKASAGTGGGVIKEETFQGYRRKNGSVGIRNEIWILSLAGCVNSVVQKLEREAQELATGAIEGICGLTHGYGCSQDGEDLRRMERMLVRITEHSNAGGVLVVGLGCSNIPVEKFQTLLGAYDCGRVKFLDCQAVDDEITAGLELLKELCEAAAGDVRVPVPVSELVIGVKCGASDTWSPLTGNPVIGMVSDRLTGQGGSVILTELSEMLGVERFLAERCVDEGACSRLEQMIREEKAFRARFGAEAGAGLTEADRQQGYDSIREKLFGFLQKGGTGPVQDVIFYGGRIKKQGLNLLQAQGYDMVAATALAAAGAHMILFSTGRGTPFGTLVPTVKIANTTELYERKKNWMDFNAGTRLEGGSLKALSEELYQYILDAASGRRQTKHERHTSREIALLKDGMTY